MVTSELTIIEKTTAGIVKTQPRVAVQINAITVSMTDKHM